MRASRAEDAVGDFEWFDEVLASRIRVQLESFATAEAPIDGCHEYAVALPATYTQKGGSWSQLSLVLDPSPKDGTEESGAAATQTHPDRIRAGGRGRLVAVQLGWHGLDERGG